MRKIRTFLSSKASMTRGEDFGEIEYPKWPILSGHQVRINGKLHEVISAPAYDPMVKLPKVLHHGAPMDDAPEPVVLVAEVANG